MAGAVVRVWLPPSASVDHGGGGPRPGAASLNIPGLSWDTYLRVPAQPRSGPVGSVLISNETTGKLIHSSPVDVERIVHFRPILMGGSPDYG